MQSNHGLNFQSSINSRLNLINNLSGQDCSDIEKKRNSYIASIEDLKNFDEE